VKPHTAVTIAREDVGGGVCRLARSVEVVQSEANLGWEARGTTEHARNNRKSRTNSNASECVHHVAVLVCHLDVQNGAVGRAARRVNPVDAAVVAVR
jgi:hypothetical protein